MRHGLPGTYTAERSELFLMVSTWDDSDEKTHVFDNERTEGAPSGSERWYISPDGKTKEVLTASEIIERARTGALSDATLVWRDGLTDWTRLDAVPELMRAAIAFRGSSAPTLVKEQPAPEAGSNAPAVPVGRLPLPSLPGSPNMGASHRVSTSGPLPPPPSLPPVRQRAASAVDPQEANTVLISSLPRAREPQPTLSSVASQAGLLIANSSRDAWGRVQGWLDQLRVWGEREVTLPRVGVVKLRLLARIGAPIAVVIVLLLVVIGGRESKEGNAISTTGSGMALEKPVGGIDLGGSGASPEGAPQTVSAAELASLEPKGTTGELRGTSATKPSKKGKEFDVLAAKSALSEAAAKAASCKQGPKGEGSVRVKLAPSGKVVSVTVTTPAFQGTAAGKCVQQVFRQATVPPFIGSDQTVYKKFVIE